jgi:hypothetical protein
MTDAALDLPTVGRTICPVIRLVEVCRYTSSCGLLLVRHPHRLIDGTGGRGGLRKITKIFSYTSRFDPKLSESRSRGAISSGATFGDRLFVC